VSIEHSKRESRSPATRRFATTRWSVVLAARRSGSLHSREALATLCKAYWYPLYAYVRRQGYQADEAQDLTQEFFATLLEKKFLKAADRELGKFRSFLLASIKHFLSNDRDRARSKKRGGGKLPISLDFEAAEGRFCREPTHDRTPERLFERRWALTLLDEVLARLRDEFVAAGKLRLFDRIKEYLTGDSGLASYAVVAAELEMSEGAVKVAVHRVRRRYRELLRDQIAQTIADPAEIDDEIRDLFAALGRH